MSCHVMLLTKQLVYKWKHEKLQKVKMKRSNLSCLTLLCVVVLNSLEYLGKCNGLKCVYVRLGLCHACGQCCWFLSVSILLYIQFVGLFPASSLWLFSNILPSCTLLCIHKCWSLYHSVQTIAPIIGKQQVEEGIGQRSWGRCSNQATLY